MNLHIYGSTALNWIQLEGRLKAWVFESYMQSLREFLAPKWRKEEDLSSSEWILRLSFDSYDQVKVVIWDKSLSRKWPSHGYVFRCVREFKFHLRAKIFLRMKADLESKNQVTAISNHGPSKALLLLNATLSGRGWESRSHQKKGEEIHRSRHRYLIVNAK